jgi:thymidine phosphorylase
MLELGGAAKSLAAGRKLALGKLADRSAWKKFEEMVEAQGGSVDQIRHPEKLPRAAHTASWVADRRGYVVAMDTEAIGHILVDLGAGRHRTNDVIDPGVGLIFHKKLGSRAEKGDVLTTVHYTNPKPLQELEERFRGAVTIGGARRAVPKLILEQL